MAHGRKWLNRAILDTSHKITFVIKNEWPQASQDAFQCRDAHLKLKALVNFGFFKFRKLQVGAADFCVELVDSEIEPSFDRS